MVGRHHQFSGHELGQTPGDSERKGGLSCCSPWGHKESDVTWWLNNSKQEFVCNARDSSSIPGSGRLPGEGIDCPLQYSWASLVAQMVKNLPAVQETWFQSLGQKDPLEEGMATYSSILAWRIPWTEEPGGLQSMGCRKASDTTEQPTPTHEYVCYWFCFSGEF